ncbi:PrsW family intramembrane metalloprotease [Nocardiopsis tropica]|uniref:PrsW family intramembrane metalloprotease n=1 Tax=Nocardiopsis tropica TaxID=109330 RepID=A0ABU7L164_9ACTN|nr:PrsW family intramembrane metalloprotease [Nocardiopsis umidischolae]MEE2055305.1 PrsW family intramembrane metalloprotease [Nocardiopsis umidischolae]
MNHAPDDRPAPAATDRGTVPSPRRSPHTPPGPRRIPAPRPGDGRSARGRRLPALASLVLITVLCLAGLLYLALQMALPVRAFLPEALLAAALGIVTLAFGFWVLRRIRPVREPDADASVVAVAWGLFAATGAGVVANGGLGAVWAKGLGLDLAGVWGAALTAPLNEEVLKLAGIVLVAVAFPTSVRGPVDGFAIGSLVGLGFEVTENFIYSMNAVLMAGGTGGLAPVVQTAVIRVGLTGPGSHWAMSAVAGTAVGLLAAVGWRPRTRRAVCAALLVALAMALHWLLDAPLFSGVLGVLAKVAVIFATTMAVYLTVRRAYRRRVRDALGSEAEELGMRRSAAVALATRHGRRRELQRVAQPEQPAVWDRQDRMVRAAEDRAALYAGHAV